MNWRELLRVRSKAAPIAGERRIETVAQVAKTFLFLNSFERYSSGLRRASNNSVHAPPSRRKFRNSGRFGGSNLPETHTLMNAKLFLFGLAAVIWLPASLAMAGPRGSGGTASGARLSGGGFSGALMSGGAMSHRMSAGPTSVGRFSTASPRTFMGAASRSRFGTGNYRARPATPSPGAGNHQPHHQRRAGVHA